MSRRSELDVLRGLLLCIMAVTHLPTRLRSYSDQPLGFVSAAEGFVFLSAFVAGSKYSALLTDRGARYVRGRLRSRALRVYGYHLALLAFAFTIGAAFAAITGRPGLRNLLAFYFDSPGVALVSGPLLLYQPPLFDILPMYILLLAASPALLESAERRGWSPVALGAVATWGAAQLGGRTALHALACAVTGARLPLDALGSFDLFAWQLLWVAGLWAGARHATRPERQPSRILLLACTVLCCGFFVLRHGIGGFAPHLGSDAWLDKWRLGPLRLVNVAALFWLIARGVLPALRWLGASVFSLLGRASLEVFAVHVLSCVIALGIVVDDSTPLEPLEEAGLLLAMFAAMILVAWRSASRRGGGLPAPRAG